MKNYEKAFGKISLWIRKTKKSAEHYICIFKKLLADEIFLQTGTLVKKQEDTSVALSGQTQER
jgi:hypothetical protein